MDPLPLEIFHYLISLLTDAETIQAARLVNKRWKAATRRITSLIWPSDPHVSTRHIKGERLTPLFPYLTTVVGRILDYPTSKDVPLTLQRCCLNLTGVNEDSEKLYSSDGKHDKVSTIPDKITLLHRQLKIHGSSLHILFDRISLDKDKLSIDSCDDIIHLACLDHLIVPLVNEYAISRNGQANVFIFWLCEGIRFDLIQQLHIRSGIGEHNMKKWSNILTTQKARLVIADIEYETHAFPPRKGDTVKNGWASSPDWLKYVEGEWIVTPE